MRAEQEAAALAAELRSLQSTEQSATQNGDLQPDNGGHHGGRSASSSDGQVLLWKLFGGKAMHQYRRTVTTGAPCRLHLKHQHR